MLTAGQGSERLVEIKSDMLRTMYRCVLRVAKTFDNKPYLKAVYPLTNPVFQRILGTGGSILYKPNSVSYVEKIKKEFRTVRERSKDELQAGFEIINHMKQIHSSVNLISLEADAAIWKLENQLNLDTRTSTYHAEIQPLPRIEPGTLLLSHPLAPSYYDRRVILIVECQNDMVTGLVLDLPYTNPITKGNPMFPEVFWGHEICQGGPYHVELTMPPTASISVLHTGIFEKEIKKETAPLEEDAKLPRKFSWLFRSSYPKKLPTPFNSPPEKFRRKTEFHRLLIPTSEEKKMPPLYCSRIEGLPSLAKKILGHERRSVRVYWGSIYWTKKTLEHELKEGLWFPVTISANFFRSLEGDKWFAEQYTKKNIQKDTPHKTTTTSTTRSLENPKITLMLPGRGNEGVIPLPEKISTTKKFPPHREPSIPDTKESLNKEKIESYNILTHFPTAVKLETCRQERFERQGAEEQRVEPIFPPQPPMCRREPLWDQIMYVLGGEYRALSTYAYALSQLEFLPQQESQDLDFEEEFT